LTAVQHVNNCSTHRARARSPLHNKPGSSCSHHRRSHARPVPPSLPHSCSFPLFSYWNRRRPPFVTLTVLSHLAYLSRLSMHFQRIIAGRTAAAASLMLRRRRQRLCCDDKLSSCRPLITGRRPTPPHRSAQSPHPTDQTDHVLCC